VIGVDANAVALYDGFRRAQKAKLSNAIFVVASAESLPDELKGCAHEVRIQFPWGSLLHAILSGDRAILAGVGALLRPGGRFRVLVSVVERDRIDGIVQLDERRTAEVTSRIAGTDVGLVPELCRQATPADIAASHSTWAKRLGVGRSRPAWLLQFGKDGPRPDEDADGHGPDRLA
jgi:16S rRNA (adenine(1408)-N(1))-methyltransferase